MRGWDCNTVTHVVGLRPFQSQLLCEQVVGRALRRASYEPTENGLMREEVAKVFGVPFQLIPFKANPSGPPPPAPKRHHVRALPEQAHLEIRFPRVEGYVQDVREVIHSHLNYVVADTKQWEQSAAYLIDTHPEVEAFVKNAGLGLGIPYFHNGEPHEFIPDFIVRFKKHWDFHFILETKGFDKLKDIKQAAARRWCAAVNAHGGFGTWEFAMVDGPGKVLPALNGFSSR